MVGGGCERAEEELGSKIPCQAYLSLLACDRAELGFGVKEEAELLEPPAGFLARKSSAILSSTADRLGVVGGGGGDVDEAGEELDEGAEEDASEDSAALDDGAAVL